MGGDRRFGTFGSWYPPAISSSLNRAGGERAVHLQAGAEVVERLVWSGERSCTYELVRGRLPVLSYRATLAAIPSTSPDRTIIEWHAEAVPAGISPTALEARISATLQAGLAGIAARFTVVRTQISPLFERPNQP